MARARRDYDQWLRGMTDAMGIRRSKRCVSPAPSGTFQHNRAKNQEQKDKVWARCRGVCASLVRGLSFRRRCDGAHDG